MLCHGYCWAGSKPLAEGLGDLFAAVDELNRP